MTLTALGYQLEMLKVEIDTVNASIRQMDEITKSVKEWTVGLWTAAIGGALATQNLNRYVGLTAAIPLLFWLVDTWHRRIQRKFIWRSIEISEFLNSELLHESFAQQKLVGFTLLDPKARVTKREGYEEFISWRRIMFFRSRSILYLGLAGLSIIVWLTILF